MNQELTRIRREAEKALAELERIARELDNTWQAGYLGAMQVIWQGGKA